MSLARGVTIQLDVPRKVRFDGQALLRLEELTGTTVLKVCRAFTESAEDKNKTKEERAEIVAANFSFTRICQITQAGLVGELPHATTAELIDLMDKNGKGEGAVGRILSYTEKVFAALSEAIGSDSKNATADLEKVEAPGRENPTAID